MDDTDRFQLRRNPRATCVMLAVTESALGVAKCMCRSVSRSGAFISGLLRPPGERLTLKLEVPGMGEVQAQAQVLYQHRHPDGSGVGVAFTEIASGDQTRLDRFIQLFTQR